MQPTWNGNSRPTPLRCGDHDALTLIDTRSTPGDVVEPPAPAGPPVRPDDLRDPHDLTRDDHAPVDSGDDPHVRDDDSRRAHHVERDIDTDVDDEPITTKYAVRRRDRYEREVTRAHDQRERLERRARRKSRSDPRGHRRAAERSRSMGADHHRARDRSAALPPGKRELRRPDRDRTQSNLPTGVGGELPRSVALVATHSSAVKRFASGPLHGTALALYFALLPFVVVAKWQLAAHQPHGLLIRGLLVALGCFWLLFGVQVARHVVRLRRGLLDGTGGSAWLAGVVVALMTLLSSSTMVGALAPTTPAVAAVSATFTDAPIPTHAPPQRPAPVPHDITSMGSLALALMAKRRGDTLRHATDKLSDADVDDALTLMHRADPALLHQLARLVGDQCDGVMRVGQDFAYGVLAGAGAPLAAVVLEEDHEGALISFAREGGLLRVPATWSADRVANAVVAVHDGRLSVATSEQELLRQLAVRSLASTLVVYAGPAGEIDEALRRCSVVVEPVASFDDAPRASTVRAGQPWPDPRRDSTIRVELLRASPDVLGLHEPFIPTLRRRCVEMAAYLALHRGEPVTGERLRTRVLSHADVDASLRTLANTASAVRRSLGTDASGPRLHPVTSSGLYVTHDVTCDVEEFHQLVASARSAEPSQGASLLRDALALVHGEPMANALRGFEWFLVEGFWARLLREGEWAALALHQWALRHDDVELAFWAIERGRLLDPYNDALADALGRVPRLRQFGGDGPSRA